MYICYEDGRQNETMTVRGIPFRVIREKEKLPNIVPDKCVELDFSGHYQTVCFLGMCCESVTSSEWWGQEEAAYDNSYRVFLGDRLGKIVIRYDDYTQDLYPLIFGVNVWNYHQYCFPKPEEGYGSGGNDMPFSIDLDAKQKLNESLRLLENTSEDALHGSKYIFAAKSNPKKNIVNVEVSRSNYRHAGIYISAFTGVSDLEDIPKELKPTSPVFYMRKDYFSALDKLARRLYQFRDEIPASDEKVYIPNFEGPDVTFGGCGIADIFTNIYRANLNDMIDGKISDEGIPRTSTPNTPNYGSYNGCGTYKIEDCFSSQVWTRDAGRTLTELTNFGYGDKLKICADRLNEMLYQYAIRHKIPHWKRIANIVPKDDNDIHNEGKENDGHSAIMMFIYNLFRKKMVDDKWLFDHRKQLVDAAEFLLWQEREPELSNFDRVLYSESEASTQEHGGYDLFSNAIAIIALEGYGKIFRHIGDDAYAEKVESFANRLKQGCQEIFVMNHPRYGEIFTDVTEDCWTYLYKRFAPLFLYSDIKGYDIYEDCPEFVNMMTNTFKAQKEEYYNPMSGRQMGYGQGYLTQTALLLDLQDEMRDCVEATAMLTYHHTDWKYIVPEGVIAYPDGRFWFRNADLGNGVQQAEIVKVARIMVGIDDFDLERGLRIIPRIPSSWESIKVTDFKIASGETVNYSYGRGNGFGEITVNDGVQTYSLTVDTKAYVDYMRVGPFDNKDVVSNAEIIKVIYLQNKYYAYVKPFLV